MKPWKVLSSSLLILLGFTAGIALRTTPTTVSAADPTPPKPLTSVAHDSTLNGAGTTASPLGLANGAVSVAKLSPTHLPSTGQVLGFDGSNLAWKNPPSGSIHVVDSAGNDVGTLINDGLVARLVNGAAFSLSITPQGFYSSGTTFSVFYTTSDCSGAPYMDADGSGFFSPTDTAIGPSTLPDQCVCVHGTIRGVD